MIPARAPLPVAELTSEKPQSVGSYPAGIAVDHHVDGCVFKRPEPEPGYRLPEIAHAILCGYGIPDFMAAEGMPCDDQALFIGQAPISNNFFAQESKIKDSIYKLCSGPVYISMEAYEYLFLVNPISGGQDKRPFYSFIEEECRALGFTYQIYETRGKNDEEEVCKLLQSASCKNLIAVGGDGTLLLAARCALTHPVSIAVIPMGSSNGMARELYQAYRHFSLLPRNPVEHAWSVIRRGEVRQIDILRINGSHYCLHLSDIGLNAKIIKRFEAGKIRGFKGYARQFLKELPLRRKLAYRLSADGQQIKGKAFMIVIANARLYGNGAVINPNGKLDDGMFEICIVRNISLRSLFKAFISVFRKKVNYQKKDLKTISARTASLQLREKQTLQTDGEIVGEVDHIDIELMPGRIRIIA